MQKRCSNSNGRRPLKCSRIYLPRASCVNHSIDRLARASIGSNLPARCQCLLSFVLRCGVFGANQNQNQTKTERSRAKRLQGQRRRRRRRRKRMPQNCSLCSSHVCTLSHRSHRNVCGYIPLLVRWSSRLQRRLDRSDDAIASEQLRAADASSLGSARLRSDAASKIPLALVEQILGFRASVRVDSAAALVGVVFVRRLAAELTWRTPLSSPGRSCASVRRQYGSCSLSLSLSLMERHF